MAGGDGSLAPVAGVAIERELPFVCIPFGTRNHFARDLGLDRDDPIGALAAFVRREERRIDVGRANERVFLNNVSLGVYAQLVHRREHQRRRREAFARLRALAILALHRQPLGITVDGEPVDRAGRARLEQRVQARAALGRRARAARRGRAASLRRRRVSCARAGIERGARAVR